MDGLEVTVARPGPEARVLAGRYRLDRPLGGGGMGSVWDGYDLRLDRPVAVKVLASPAGEPAVQARLDAEARTAARLVHPNVVGVFDVGEDRGRPFIVMERLSGRTLADALPDGPMTPEAVRRLGLDVAAALAAAHASGIVHCDVKPGNVLEGDGGCWKVSDFGIARTLDGTGADVTSPALLVGTPAYVAPESVEGFPPTPAVDIYGLGAVLYQALTGCRPYDEPTPVATLARIAAGPPPPVRVVAPQADPALAAIIDRAMAREPSRRFATAEDLRDALASAAPDVTVAIRPPGPGDTQVMHPPPWVPAASRRRRPVAFLAAAGTALAVLAAVVALGWSIVTSSPVRSAPPTPTPTTVAGHLPAPLDASIHRLQRDARP
jgi:serine/threonine protein kinase